MAAKKNLNRYGVNFELPVILEVAGKEEKVSPFNGFVLNMGWPKLLFKSG